MVTGGGECFRILIAIEGVSQKHPTEKHNFGDQEHPHSQGARLTLLLHVLKMVLQRRVARFMVDC
jgi:hypothetical protein